MRARLIGLLALGLALGGAEATGQTLFTWPDTAVNLAAYATAEDCYAATARASGAAEVAALVERGWRDTLPRVAGEELEPVPAQVAATARGCLVRFAAADSVPITEFRLLLPLYLIAGWDAKARTLVDRRLAAVAPNAGRELAAVLDTAVSVALMRHAGRLRPLRFPPKLGLVEALVTEHLPRVRDRVARLRIYAKVTALTASLVNDTALARRVGAQAVPLLDSLTEADRAELEDEMGPLTEQENVGERFYAMLNWVLGKRTFLDSLRRSTAAFVKLKRDNWVRATGRPPEAYGMPIGDRAPALQGEVWLGRADSSASRPTRGRVALVVFLSHSECVGPVEFDADAVDGCAGTLAALRRLERRFPALETTVVAHTAGYFGYLKDSLTVAREAELTQRWLAAYGVRAPLIMTATEFWRLPAPDGRRVNRELPNRTAYTFGKRWGLKNTSAFLIDPEGVIVHVDRLNRDCEPEFAELIEILLARQVARS